MKRRSLRMTVSIGLVLMLTASAFLPACDMQAPVPTATQAPAAPATQAPAATALPAPTATVPPAPAAPATIKIGAVIDVTGPLAAFGAECKWGYEYFAEVVNADGGIYVAEYDKKIPVEILYGDHSADEQKAVTEMEYLVEQGVVVLSGSTAIMPLGQVVAEKNGVPLVIANGSLTEPFQQGFRYIFSTSWMNNEMAQWPFLLMEYLPDPKPTKIGFMEEQNLMGIDYSSNLQKEALKRGYTDLVIQKYQRFGGDYSTQILAFKEAGVDFVYAPMIGPDGMKFWTQMQELDFVPKAILQLIAPADRRSWVTLPKFNYVITTNDYHWATGYKGAKEFDEAYQADHNGEHATELAGDAYAAMQIIADAIERAGSLDHDKLRDAVAATNMETIKGPIQFMANGMPIREYFAVQYIDGVETIIWPAKMAERGPVYPFPAWTDPNR